MPPEHPKWDKDPLFIPLSKKKETSLSLSYERSSTTTTTWGLAQNVALRVSILFCFTTLNILEGTTWCAMNIWNKIVQSTGIVYSEFLSGLDIQVSRKAAFEDWHFDNQVEVTLVKRVNDNVFDWSCYNSCLQQQPRVFIISVAREEKKVTGKVGNTSD